MALLLARRTALEWMRPHRGSFGQLYHLNVLDLEGAYYRYRRHEALLDTFSSPIHVVTCLRDGRRRSKAVCSHMMSLPQGKYPCYMIERAVFCSAPELLMMQMGTVLGEEELLFLGYELCGRYGFSQAGKLVQCPQTSNVQALSAFASQCAGVHGRKRVARVLPQVIDGAASPMEAALSICFTGPVAKGGFGLPHPLLNHALAVKGSARGLWDGDTIIPDLLWLFAPNGQETSLAQGRTLKGLALEYDSDDNHTGAQNIAHDSRRRNVLEEMGYRVITVTNEQFANTRELERVAMMVARQLGVSLEEATDEAWVARDAFCRRIRDIALHPERLLGT